MGINSGIYKLVLVLHILTAIVGFGAVLLNGIYGQQARSRKGTEGLAISQANFLVSKIGMFFIYAVFVFGILLVVLSDKVWSFSDSWIVAAIVLYVLGIGLAHGAAFPNRAANDQSPGAIGSDGPPTGGRGGLRRAPASGHRARRTRPPRRDGGGGAVAGPRPDSHAHGLGPALLTRSAATPRSGRPTRTITA